MKIDPSRKNVLGTALRIRDRDSGGIITEALTVMERARAPALDAGGARRDAVSHREFIVAMLNIIIERQILVGRWRAYDIHRPKEMGWVAVSPIALRVHHKDFGAMSGLQVCLGAFTPDDHPLPDMAHRRRWNADG